VGAGVCRSRSIDDRACGADAERQQRGARAGDRAHRESTTLLEYTWDKDVVRWELEPISDGRTRLTLTHTVDDAAWLARVTPGWHISIDEVQALLDGDPVEPLDRGIPYTKPPGWRELAHGYAKLLGVAPPEDA
jgi:hypothetical protein